MTYNDHILGQVWAAEGESRPRFWRTILAWLPAHGGALLYVRDGNEQPHWLLSADWEAWLAENNGWLVPTKYTQAGV